MNELQNSASIELEIAYGRKLSKQFIGPLIESETKKSIEFRFFKVDECDTTFAFIEVSKRGVGGSTVSSITKGCNDSIN